MESIEAKFPENPPLKTHKLVLVAQICLRILAIATALAATWVMVTSKETIVVFGFQLDARYSYSSAFKFFAFANAVACAFTFLSLLFVFFFGRHGLTPTSYFLLFLHDLFIMSLMLSGVAAGTAIGYVGRYGNSHTGWLQICDRLIKFCHRVTTSMIFSFLSVVCLLALTIVSASKSRHIKEEEWSCMEIKEYCWVAKDELPESKQDSEGREGERYNANEPLIQQRLYFQRSLTNHVPKISIISIVVLLACLVASPPSKPSSVKGDIEDLKNQHLTWR
ncbi:CASP-like protein 1F2 [Durio zibethinus]|uniref:CASP-like protein n=1 Tax=Durio zibethinus TaxID=66656 RepID=A0A6P5WL16_DURZI|nr:CASP-like protein 1F2 [Durio zibethinus]